MLERFPFIRNINRDIAARGLYIFSALAGLGSTAASCEANRIMSEGRVVAVVGESAENMNNAVAKRNRVIQDRLDDSINVACAALTVSVVSIIAARKINK